MKLDKIMSSLINFVNTSDFSYDLMNSEKNNEEAIDPLQETGNGIQYNCHKIDSIVFAESLEINYKNNKSLKDDIEKLGSKEDDIVIIDNVLVQKRKGRKYKKYHIIIEDSSNLSCPQSNCNRKFSTTKLLKAHIRKVHCADKQFVCEECGRTFSCRYLLVQHSAVHSKKTVQCNVCAMVLSERTSLSAHMRTHSGIKPHSCSICNKQFTRKSTLDTHVKFVHRSGELQCPKCNDRFKSRSQWTQHTTTHHRDQKHDEAPR